jgi:hypothetical protein
MDQAEDLGEQDPWDGDLSELRDDVASWWMALVPVLISFSRRLVSDRCSTSCGSANDAFRSRRDSHARHPTVPLPRVKRKDPSGKLTFALEFPVPAVVRPRLAPAQDESSEHKCRHRPEAK